MDEREDATVVVHLLLHRWFVGLLVFDILL